MFRTSKSNSTRPHPRTELIGGIVDEVANLDPLLVRHLSFSHHESRIQPPCLAQAGRPLEQIAHLG